MTDPADTRAVLLKPGDALLIGNVGTHEATALADLVEALAIVRQALGLSTVTVFGDDIEMAAAAPVVPASDAVVLRVFDREAVAEHRAELAEWLTSNGIDPSHVAADWLSIEQAGDHQLVRYPAYRLDQDGRHLRDPRARDRAWTVERVSPLVKPLSLSNSHVDHSA
ncbi:MULTISPECIES: hypothetical protein [Streptomyces]|uniref:hypothetical protein n=1 Tax=Streptomyces TaxID=1883 RepID=UPI0033EEC089